VHGSLGRDLRFHPDDPANLFVLPVAPPPPQLVDGQNYGKPDGPNQNQSLVSVPEEEESDWSEMGDEAPRLLLMGSGGLQASAGGFLPGRGEARRGGGWPGRGDLDGDGESGGEELVRCHPAAGSLHLPQLHFTLNGQMFHPPPGHGCPATYRVVPVGRGASSPVLLRSASLEEIGGGHHHMQQEEKQEEEEEGLARRPGDVMHGEDPDNEILHHWWSWADGGVAVGREAQATQGSEGMADDGGGLDGLSSAQRMLNHFVCELQHGDTERPDRAGVKGWTGGLPEEVLGAGRTKL